MKLPFSINLQFYSFMVDTRAKRIKEGKGERRREREVGGGGGGWDKLI